MIYIVCHMFVGGKLTWERLGSFSSTEETGITISFPFHSPTTQREATRIIDESLVQNEVEWLIYKRPNWIFQAEKFKEAFPSREAGDWLTGALQLEMHFDIVRRRVFDKEQYLPSCTFVVTPELVSDQLPKRLFLSHKGIDKPQVRRYKSALEVVGLSPWLDEEAMVAGVELERGLLRGFKESCAAVFFVTPNYQDTGFLATEINYAMREKRDKGDRFSIITLALSNEHGKLGIVPDLLQQYVWKQPASELDAYCEIIRALPIELSTPKWRA